MTYTDLELFMENLNQLIYGSHNPLFNNPSVISERPQFQQLHQELGSLIKTLFIHEHHHHLYEVEKVTSLKRRFKDVAEEAQDITDLFLSAIHFRNRGLSPRSDVFKTSLHLENVMRSIESIKVEFMTMNIDNMKMHQSHRIDHLKTQSDADAGTSCTRNPLGTRKVLEDIIVGLDDDTKVIVERLIEDRKQLDVVSIVGMGGIGKTTLATKVFNDPYVVHHFHVRAWATVSQNYEKKDVLIQILASIGVQINLEKAGNSQLHEMLHKRLMGKRYLIVIDDIWSKEAWDDLKKFLPHNSTRSRILLTSRHKEVALHPKPHRFIHLLSYLTEEQSWELLCKKVFHEDKCPIWAISPGKKIAKQCQGLPLALVVIAGVLAKESMSEDFWVKIACSVSSYIVSSNNTYLETFALSYHHLPCHLRECFLYLGGFPEDFVFVVRRLIWLWVAEGFIQEAGTRSLEDTAEAYLLDLVDRNLLIVTERKFNGGVKACKVHDIVRKLCLEKAEEERFFMKINGVRTLEVMTPYKQGRVFTNQDIYIVNSAHPGTPIIRSLLCFHESTSLIHDMAEYFRSFALLRVLDLQKCGLIDFPPGIALLVHLRYLAIWLLLGFPSSICNLWSLQTLILKTSHGTLFLPSNISDLVNLRNLWSNKDLYLRSIENPMYLETISNIILGDGVESYDKCFPNVKKLASTIDDPDEKHDFRLLPFLETLKLYGSDACKKESVEIEFPKGEPNCGKNHIRFPATLKKLTLVGCYLPWSDIAVIQLLPNLEVLKLIKNIFEGSLWNTGEEQFRQLKFLRLKKLNIKQWEVCSINFPCLKRLQVLKCPQLTEIPIEIGDISTLELLEVDSWKMSIVKSLQSIQQEQHDVGNYELKINLNGKDLLSFKPEEWLYGYFEFFEPTLIQNSSWPMPRKQDLPEPEFVEFYTSIEMLQRSAHEDGVSMRARLNRSPQRMSTYANQGRLEKLFNIGEWVYVRLKVYQPSHKLGKCFFGPYQVLERIGEVAYRLALPTDSRIHPVFHVSLLRQCLGDPSTYCTPLPHISEYRIPVMQPESILDHRTIDNLVSSFEGSHEMAGSDESEDTWDDDF